MALSTPLNYRGINIENAYIRVNRVFGGKKEGWNSVVGVYASAEAALTESPIEEFNQVADYVADVFPLVAVYEKLKEKYPVAIDC